MKKLSLAQKIVLTQIISFVIIYLIVVTLTPTIVYRLTVKTEAEVAMSFNEQVAMRMEERFSELKRFSSVVERDAGLNDLLKKSIADPSEKNMAKLRLYMSDLIQKDGVSSYHVLGMYLDIDGAERFSTNTVGLHKNIIDYITESAFVQYEEKGGSYKYIQPFVFAVDSNQSLFGNDFSKGYGYISAYNRNGISGRLVIISSYDEISYIANDLQDYCNDYLILKGDGTTLAPSVENSHINAEYVRSHMTYGNSYSEGYVIDSDGLYTMYNIDSGNWMIMTYLSRDEVLSKNLMQSIIIWVSIGSFGVIAALAVIIIVRKFVKPLREVSHQMEAIAHGNFNARVYVESGDEIGQVSESFNLMAAQLEENMQAMLEKEKLEQKMKYSILIAQVDPHFLYNTMNTITYLAQKGKSEDIIIVNKAIIGILRDRLRIGVSEVYDTVKQEINVVEQYLIIQKYRYAGMFKVRMEIEEDIWDVLILKNLLQPLVENALSHGILENKDENGEPLGGCITIKIRKEGKHIIASVSDNGAGMSEKRLKEVLSEETAWERGSHIGIRNVKDRIAYIYGDKGSITINAKEGFGTEVILRLPLHVEEGKNGNVRVTDISTLD